MLVGPAALLIVADAWRWRWFTHPDLRLARDAAEVLWSPQGLHLYAEAPLAQMGPLAIALSPLPHGVYNVVIAALALPVLLMAARPLRVDGVGASRRWGWSAASLLLVAPWAQLAWKGHADDALVLVGAAVMVTALAAKRHRWLLPGWVIAVAGKPTALALAPFLLASPLWLLVSVAVTAAIWGPFAAADPGALMRAGQGVMAVVPGDGLAYLGVATGRPPVWVRPVQLLLSWAGSLLGMLRARPAAGLLLGLAARAVLEPNPAPAYSISLVAVALFVDAGRRVPLATVLAATSFWTSQTVLQGGSGWPRILSLMALVGWAGWVASGKALELAGSPLGLRRTRATRGVSAIAAAGLWTGVMVVPAQAAPPVLKQGSLGDGVRCVQWGVNHLLPASPGNPLPVRVDGVYGPVTTRSVYSLQVMLEVAVNDPNLYDGWVGPRTGTALHVAGFSAAPARWHCPDTVPFDPELTDQAVTALHDLRHYDAIRDAQINDAQERLQREGRGPDLVSVLHAPAWTHLNLTQREPNRP